MTELIYNTGEGNDNRLQYSCLENSMDREVWWAAAHGVTENWTQLTGHIYNIDNQLGTTVYSTVYRGCCVSWDNLYEKRI